MTALARMFSWLRTAGRRRPAPRAHQRHQDVAGLRSALLAHGAGAGTALLMGRDTGYAGAVLLGEDEDDRQVIDAIRSVPVHYAGLSTLTATVSTEFKVSAAQVNLTGAVYNPYGNTVDIRKSQALGTTVGNTVTGGADQVFSFQQGLTAGTIAVLDLTTLTDLLGRASPGVVRLKAVHVRLLSAADDSTINPAPVSTSTCLVTNNPPSSAAMDVPCAMNYTNGGSGLTLTLTTSGGALTAVAIGAAGSGYPKSSFFNVAPQQAGGSGAVVGVATNASGVPTSVVFNSAAAGAGYTNATVPSVVLGHRFLYTGGVDCYFDPQANGICGVGTTNKKVAIVNLDGTNPITVEVSLICGSN